VYHPPHERVSGSAIELVLCPFLSIGRLVLCVGRTSWVLASLVGTPVSPVASLTSELAAFESAEASFAT
jgi:hypothetical protein